MPLLAVSFAILRFSFLSDVADAIRTWMLNTLLADSVSGVVTYIQQFLEETRGSARPCWVVFSIRHIFGVVFVR